MGTGTACRACKEEGSMERRSLDELVAQGLIHYSTYFFDVFVGADVSEEAAEGQLLEPCSALLQVPPGKDADNLEMSTQEDHLEKKCLVASVGPLRVRFQCWSLHCCRFVAES